MIRRGLYIDQIERLVDKEPVKIMTGVRRSGKTYLLYGIRDLLIEHGVSRDNIFLISFESGEYNKIVDYRQLDLCISDLTRDVHGRVYLLFDEIQVVDGWEKSINACRVDLDCDIYITGSNSELLSGEMSTLLAGRFFQIDVFPFSFREFIQYKDEVENVDVGNLNLLFDEYVSYGGMPSIMQVSCDDRYSYLGDIYSSILLKDIISRHNLRNSDMLNRILDYVIMNIGKNFSASNIVKFLKHEGRKISKDTILDYLLFSLNACFIYCVSREDIRGKKVLSFNEKYYLVDHGFYQSRFGVSVENMGSILENIVFVELLRRGWDVRVGVLDEGEVDFICRKGKDKVYIQVAYLLSSEETYNREFSKFDYIDDHFDKYVLSMDSFDFSTNGIKHRNIIDFLISDFI